MRGTNDNGSKTEIMPLGFHQLGPKAKTNTYVTNLTTSDPHPFLELLQPRLCVFPQQGYTAFCFPLFGVVHPMPVSYDLMH